MKKTLTLIAMIAFAAGANSQIRPMTLDDMKGEMKFQLEEFNRHTDEANKFWPAYESCLMRSRYCTLEKEAHDKHDVQANRALIKFGQLKEQFEIAERQVKRDEERAAAEKEASKTAPKKAVVKKN